MIWKDILVLTTVVILPVIPAFIMFKYLPPGEVRARGLFKGMNLKLRGSFAGYFIVLLFVSSFCLVFTHQRSSLEKKITEWNVEGKIKLEDEDFSRDNLSITIKPPNLAWGLNGRFSFSPIAISRDRKKKESPTLVIRKAGYEEYHIRLEKYIRYSENDEHPGIIHFEDDELIKIMDPMILKKKREKRTRVQLTAVPLEEEG